MKAAYATADIFCGLYAAVGIWRRCAGATTPAKARISTWR
jgi:hypothetical protein